MKLLRIPFALAVAFAILTSGALVRQAVAIDDFWVGDVSSNYALSGGAGFNINWSIGNIPPRATSNQRAVIGTDNPSFPANSSDAPFGSPILSSGVVSPGGVALGIREFDYGDFCADTDYCNPDPDAGALVGKLTIATGGNLVSLTSGGALSGADGRILVGVEGRGYLTMTGGTLNGLALIVAGETGPVAETTEEGLSYARFSGSSTVNISNGTSGVATFGRRLRVTGPSVNFNATGNIQLQSSNIYTAQITSSSAHSPLKTTNNVVLGGALEVEYSSSAPDPSGAVDETWNLFDYAGGLVGGFNNLSAGGDVSVTGFPETVPGEVYRLRTTTGGVNGKLLQLVHDQVLVLRANRDTGELSIRNPLSGAIVTDGYTVYSNAAGSLVDTYKGISGAPAGDTGWVKYGLSANTLSELKITGSLSPTTPISLGTGFDKEAVADVLPFGNDGEDLIFEYTTPGAPGASPITVRGHVEYIGTPFANNLVLRVNPTTGDAEILNDSKISVSFDGYSILSSTDALDDSGWDGIDGVGGNWSQSPPATSDLTETNVFGSLTLAAGASISIGDIGVFTDELDQEGLTLEFIRTDAPPLGDYNEDGKVSAADYTVWRDHLEDTAALPNDDTPGVGTDDYDRWIANFGLVSADETTFRTGAVRFDLGAGSGAGSSASSVAVPEPSSALLMLMGLGAVVLFGRDRSNKARRQSGQDQVVRGTLRQLGVSNMSRRFAFCLSTLVGLCIVLSNVPQSSAVTMGIPLTNGDMELPGPVDFKTLAFYGEDDEEDPGVPIPGIIPGWTFVGPGVEDFGDEIPGDSGVEGAGNPGNEMILSTLDGVVFQTSAHAVTSIPATQAYRLSFDARDIFTIDADGAQFETPQAQLTVRLYYMNGATRTTIGSPLVLPALTTTHTNFTLSFAGGSAPLTPALTKLIGVEFDTTSFEANPLVASSWVGIDNVLLQIAGVLPGDLDGDGDADFTDYAIVRDNQQVAQTYLAQGEITGDYFVNLNDFRAWKSLAGPLGSGSGSGSTVSSLPSVPEPSTLVMLMIVASVAVGSFLRRNRISLGRMRLLLLAVVGITAALASASRSQAELFYYEPFLVHDPIEDPAMPGDGEYNVTLDAATLHVPLDGQGPTLPSTPNPPAGPWGTNPNFLSGNWTSATIDYASTVVQEGLSFIGAPALGGAASVRPVADPEEPGAFLEFDGRAGRYLTTPWDDTTNDTFYMGFLANFGTTTGGMGYRTVEFWSTGVDISASNPDGFRIMEIGYSEYGNYGGGNQQNPDRARMAINVDGDTILLEDGPLSYNDDGGTHLIVVKFELSSVAAMDRISLFLDPLSASEPDIASAVHSGLDFSLDAFSAISQFGGGGGAFPYDANARFDELRFGDAFLDVLVEFPYPGDTDGDGDADINDFNTIVANFNQPCGLASCGDVALNSGKQGSDGRVSLGDFRIWKDNRTDGGSGAGSDALLAAFFGGELAVPEPSSLCLAALAALALCGATRGAKLTPDTKC